MSVVKDRRRSVRVMVRGDAVVHLPPGPLSGRCLDLSTGGLLVLAPAPTQPEPGTRLEVEIHVEGEHLRLGAELLRRRDVNAGQLLAFRFVDPEPAVRQRLQGLVDGKLLRTIQSDAAVVLDLRALRQAAAASSTAANDEAAPAPEPAPPPAAAPRERLPYVPAVFQGTWRDDELVTSEFQAIEAHSGGTVIAPAPEPLPEETTATFGPAPAPAVEPTTVLSLDDDADPPEDLGPADGTVVLAPPPAPDPEATLVIDPVPVEPTVRYAIPALAEEPTEPSVTAELAVPEALRDTTTPIAAFSIPREAPTPPPLLRGEPVAISGETVVVAIPEAARPRPSQLALAAALSLLRRRGPVPRPGAPRPPRVIVSVPHYQLPAAPSPWSPRP